MRGSVWEEAIINCPRHIQLLCMSATVENPQDLGGWISQVRILAGLVAPGLNSSRHFQLLGTNGWVAASEWQLSTGHKPLKLVWWPRS